MQAHADDYSSASGDLRLAENPKTEDNRLGKYFTGTGLLRFALPNILMMIFTSIYVIVDGFFTARLVNTMAVGSLSIVYPVISFFYALAYMLATGGSAVVARQMGQNHPLEARQNFTFIAAVTFISSTIISGIMLLCLNDLIHWLGASDLQFEQCMDYGRIIIIFGPFACLQCIFQIFFVTAGHPGFGLVITLAAGVANMVFDYVLMGPLQMGIAGAAWATVIGYCVVAVIGFFFFVTRKKEPLHFVRPYFRPQILGSACLNGSSEMVTNLAISLTTLLYNYYFMQFYAENGVSAISIVLYIQFIFNAVIFGYASGIAPIISYKYGHCDLPELRSIIKNGLIFITAASIAVYIISLLSIDEMLRLFVDKTDPVFDIAKDGFSYFAPCLLFMGISIFASSMFTALSDGKTSAIISFGRTLVFLSLAIIVMSEIFGANGAWGAVSAAELLGLLVSIWYLFGYRQDILARKGLFSPQKMQSVLPKGQ